MGIAVALLVLGLALGGMIGYFVRQPAKESKQREQEMEQQLAAKEQEFTEYKQQVANHFMQTANLVTDMTESYRAVHLHLAEGANNLCGDFLGMQQLDIKQTKLLDKEAKASAIEASTVESTQDIPEPESVMVKDDIVDEASETAESRERSTTTASTEKVDSHIIH